LWREKVKESLTMVETVRRRKKRKNTKKWRDVIEFVKYTRRVYSGLEYL
jgi:hypothetical protein